MAIQQMQTLKKQPFQECHTIQPPSHECGYFLFQCLMFELDSELRYFDRIALNLYDSMQKALQTNISEPDTICSTFVHKNQYLILYNVHIIFNRHS